MINIREFELIEVFELGDLDCGSTIARVAHDCPTTGLITEQNCGLSSFSASKVIFECPNCHDTFNLIKEHREVHINTSNAKQS